MGSTGARADALARTVDQLLAAAAGGPAPACDVRFGAAVTAILAAAERSIAERATVTVTPSRL